jgi:excisionase family DNA binding protein
MVLERTRWVTEREVLAYLAISHGHLVRLRREGVIQGVNLGAAVRFDLDQVDASLERLRDEQHAEREV